MLKGKKRFNVAIPKVNSKKNIGMRKIHEPNKLKKAIGIPEPCGN